MTIETATGSRYSRCLKNIILQTGSTDKMGTDGAANVTVSVLSPFTTL